MTEREIRNLNGLELRKAIAKDLGYKAEYQITHNFFGSYGGWCLTLDGIDIDMSKPFRDSEDETDKDIPPFESDIGLAWQLAEKMRANIIIYDDGMSGVTVNENISVYGPTATAICQAYLLAKATGHWSVA